VCVSGIGHYGPSWLVREASYTAEKRQISDGKDQNIIKLVNSNKVKGHAGYCQGPGIAKLFAKIMQMDIWPFGLSGGLRIPAQTQSE
jgi:hypothetical protein